MLAVAAAMVLRRRDGRAVRDTWVMGIYQDRGQEFLARLARDPGLVGRARQFLQLADDQEIPLRGVVEACYPGPSRRRGRHLLVPLNGYRGGGGYCCNGGLYESHHMYELVM